VGSERFRRGVAEFVGTFALVFGGAGSIMSGGGLLGVAVAHGLILAIMVSALGHISGAHFNPAVTFGFLVTRKIAPALAGATGDAVRRRGRGGAAPQVDLPGRDQRPGQALRPGPKRPDLRQRRLRARGRADVLPCLGRVRHSGRPARAFTTIADILIGRPLTGAAMNPARAFGPQLVQNVWSDAWIWYLGPLLGGGLAAVVYDVLYHSPVLRPAPPGPPETGLDEPRPGDTALR
jgi:Major intrinsic protein